MSNTAVLPQGAGYGVVVGIGLFFSAFMLVLTAVQARYTAFSPKSSEEFTSASRSVKPGLIASGIVSAWTWAATLLQSSAVAYKFGISGPWWYGAGATVQILLFAMLAAKLKLNAPYAHTWLEIVGVRWGKTAHLVFMFFGLATNIIVSSMLILGGSATVTDLTGMSTIAACFLIPLGVAIYVVVGGMRSTLLCDYTHTSVLFVIILTFVFTVYASSDKIGSPQRMHDLLTAASATSPVPGNAHGSYVTIRSKNGLIFGVINIIGNFATVFQDQAYWQRAIASRPASTVKAYLLGGLAWFAIPFTFATTLGRSGYAGVVCGRCICWLPAAAAAAALLGKGGAAALLVLLFLAVTSACSAELIAVSSLLTYDVYKTYINPKATEEQILRVDILECVPIALCITWSKANKWGCIAGSVAGFVAGIVAWLVTTSTLNGGVINVVTSGGDFEMLAGNLASIGWPDNFDWETTRAINKPVPADSEDKKHASSVKESVAGDSFTGSEEEDELNPVALNKAFKFATYSSLGLVVYRSYPYIPLPLFFSHHIFTWTFLSAISVVIYPLYESRHALVQILKGIYKDLFTRGSGKFVADPAPTTPA
ncbi:urea transporter [Pholiota molesta]|nr:urea transporter [Pholiota molesta]